MIKNPTSYKGRNSSQPIVRDMHHIATIIHWHKVVVSVTEAYLTTDTAVVLKQAIEGIRPNENNIKMGFCDILRLPVLYFLGVDCCRFLSRMEYILI